jgi:SAM-dependent methyltransferase
MSATTADTPALHAADAATPPSPLVWPLADSGPLIDLIVEVTGASREWVQQQIDIEEASPGELQRRDFQAYGLSPHVWSDAYDEFYRATTWGLVGNPVWNRRRAKLEIREWIGRQLASPAGQSLKILMIGDGSGFDSLYLAQCGHHVTYSERQRETVAFARKLFAGAGAEVAVCEDERQLTDESFDAVVCLDVMEHVPQPVEFVGWMTRLLRPGGRLIVHAPFFFVSWHYPTHLKSNQKYSGDLRRLYKPHGLILCDGRPFWDPLVLAKPAVDGSCPYRRRARVALLRLTGLLLAVGRYWNWPHVRMAQRAIRRVD